MARSIETIQQEIITEKNAQPALANLDSQSRTAIWRLWTHVLATVIHYQEVLFDTLKAEIRDEINAGITGTPDWYVRQLFAFQEGDQIQVIDNKLQYATIDEAKRIINRAAYENQQGLLILKAATSAGTTITPLTVTQLDQVTAYLNRIKFAGTNIELRSSASDKVRLYADVYFDGLLDPFRVRENIYAAIRAYFDNFNNSNFGGVLRIASLIDAIQSVTGVVDVFLREDTKVLIASGSLISVNRRYILFSGYGALDDSQDYDPTTQITLIPADNG